MELLSINDIRAEILNHLRFRDIYQLKYTNRFLHQQINFESYITREILRRLKPIFEDKYNDFLAQLNDTGSVISGSFIIQALLDEHWIGSDLDLFIPTKNVKYLDIDGVSTEITEVEEFIFQSFNHPGSCRNSDHHYRDTITDIEHVRNYGINHHEDGTKTNYPVGCIQTVAINIDKEEIKRFMEDYSDFDICRNWYGVSNNRSYCKIYRLHEIMNKTTQFKFGKKISNTMKRYQKYRDRGFCFTNDIKPMLSTIFGMTDVYKLFYITPIDHESTKYRVIKGDLNILAHYDFYADGIIDTEISSSYSFEKFARCDEFATCPFKFCYQNVLTTPKHFHLFPYNISFGDNDHILIVE